MRILLIEPNWILAETYSKALHAAGHEIVIASGAQDGVLAADSQKPELVILELQLPGHSGVEFLYEFRSYIDWQNTPILLHTMIPSSEVRSPRELGYMRHLYKPATTLQQLVGAVHESALAVA